MRPTREAVLRQRLATQRLSPPMSGAAQDVVSLLTAMQSQECAHAFWSVGMRTTGYGLADVRRAFDDGRILRTHVLRQTWHLVHPSDIRWLLALTSPRVEVAAGTTYRRYQLAESVRGRAADLIMEHLSKGNYATRGEVSAVLAAAGLPAQGIPLAYLLMHAELRGLLCSGPMRGAQHTYAVLDERVPPSPALDDEAALATLTRRFFIGHGPASLADFTRWSSLTLAQAKVGLAAVSAELDQMEVDAVALWFAPDQPRGTSKTELTAYLLPLYDEVSLSYPALNFPVAADHPHPPDMDTRTGSVIARERNVGTWRRSVTGRSVTVETQLAPGLPRDEHDAIGAAVDRLVDFLSR